MGWSKGPKAGVGVDFPRKGWGVGVARERGGEGERVTRSPRTRTPKPSQAIARTQASVVREIEVQVLSQQETRSDFGFKESFWHQG